MPDLDTLRKTEWCPEFDRYARNRMIMGAFRYAPIADSNYGKYDICGEIIRRVELYRQDRNLEHLVDARNICMIGYIHGRRMGETLHAVDDGVHAAHVNGGATI
jgi:hypothetical protein